MSKVWRRLRLIKIFLLLLNCIKVPPPPLHHGRLCCYFHQIHSNGAFSYMSRGVVYMSFSSTFIPTFMTTKGLSSAMNLFMLIQVGSGFHYLVTCCALVWLIHFMCDTKMYVQCTFLVVRCITLFTFVCFVSIMNQFVRG